MAGHNDFGARGEKIAKEYLEKQGYEILDENWIFNKAEIDLITYRDSVIVFVEVKTRRTNSFGEPEDFVDTAKQKLLTSAADEYIYLMNHKHEIRFDIISIMFDKFDQPVLKHIEDAFWPSES